MKPCAGPKVCYEVANWLTCDHATDMPLEGPIAVAGDRLDVPGYPKRTTLVQIAQDPTAPMIVVFHAHDGCIANMQKRTDLDAIANSRGVSMLWLSGEPSPGRDWHPSGIHTEPYKTRQQDDLAYVDAVFTALHAEGIKPRRVVAVGVSNGAGMAVYVPCMRPNLFDGAISVAGWLPLPCHRAPLSLMVFAGGTDPYYGPDIAKMMSGYWRTKVVDCPNKPLNSASAKVIVRMWTGCTENAIVRVVVLPEVPHLWPKYTYYDIDEDIIHMALGSFPSPSA